MSPSAIDGIMVPFLFRQDDQYFVKIAIQDYVAYDSKWMCDPHLRNWCLISDVGQVKETHSFNTEADAIEFIRRWWRNN